MIKFSRILSFYFVRLKWCLDVERCLKVFSFIVLYLQKYLSFSKIGGQVTQVYPIAKNTYKDTIGITFKYY